MKKLLYVSSVALLSTSLYAGGEVLNQGASMVGGTIDGQVENVLQNFFYNNEGVTEISFQGTTSNTPDYSILLVRPLTESEDKIDNTFVQTSMFYDGDRTTGNFGLGYRHLMLDKKLMLGTNIFYDQEFPYNHQRMSIGGEIRTTVGEINANYYKGLSGWKTVDLGNIEKALGGYDVELGIALPYIPTAFVRAKTFKWNGVEGGEDIKGHTLSLTGSVYPGVTVEAGKNYYNSNYQDTRFVKVSYNFNFGTSKSISRPVFAEQAYSFESMEDRRFEKVRRENRIIKQVGKNIGITVRGI